MNGTSRILLTFKISLDSTVRFEVLVTNSCEHITVQTQLRKYYTITNYVFFVLTIKFSITDSDNNY